MVLKKGQLRFLERFRDFLLQESEIILAAAVKRRCGFYATFLNLLYDLSFLKDSSGISTLILQSFHVSFL